jgi:aminotransferase
VFTRAELKHLATFAARHDLFVLTDEIYKHFVYNSNRRNLPASLPGMQDRTITISGLSRTFSITGWGVGSCLGDARWG